MPSLALPDVRAHAEAAVDYERGMIDARFGRRWDEDAASYGLAVVSFESLVDAISGSVPSMPAGAR